MTENKKPQFDEKELKYLLLDYISYDGAIYTSLVNFIDQSIRKAQREAVEEVLDEINPGWKAKLETNYPAWDDVKGWNACADKVQKIKDRIRVKYQEGK